MNKKIDLTGKKIGRWVVLYQENKLFWFCECECGTQKAISQSSLRSGKSKSCGCYKMDVVTTHNKSGSKEFAIWSSMLSRCYCPTHKVYSRYGGRGITVCDRWKNNFQDFYYDMGAKPEKHSLDRIDNSGNYEPNNCRWATSKQQNRNNSNNRMITVNGETKCIAEWSELMNLNLKTISRRLKQGKTPEEAILPSAEKYHKHKGFE